jgi:hypothetical protein
MRKVLPTLALLCGLPHPVWADPVPGADDPAFRLPFERALQGDDPTAVQEIHAAAEAGNEAALRALPTVLIWLPPKGTLAERNRYRKVNGVPVEEAVAAVSPVAAAWRGGRGDEAGPVLDRARMLGGAGEIGKAHALYRAWFGYFVPAMPIRMTEPPPPLFLFSAILASRLVYANDPADGPFAAQLLRDDRMEGWLALHWFNLQGLSDIVPPGDHFTAEKIVLTANIEMDAAASKMQGAGAIVEWYRAAPGDRDPAMAAEVASVLRGRAEFAPVEAFCSATCPQTAPACEAAWLYLMAPYEVDSDSRVPEIALIATEDFFATPRGESLVIPRDIIAGRYDASVLGGFLDTTNKLDACLARSVRSSLGSDAP